MEKLFEDFIKVQKELKPVKRNAKGYNYTYADIAKVWGEVEGIITKHNFIVTHQVKERGVKTFAIHKSGEKLKSFIPFSHETAPQKRGSEITYYKRYNIQSIFNIVVEGEDDDAEPFESKGRKYNIAPPISER